MNCKLCGESALELWDRYLFCNSCKLILSPESSIPDEEECLRIYNLHNNTFQCEGYVNMFKGFIKDYIDPFTFSNMSSLDYGCGPGPDFVLSGILKSRGFTGDKFDPVFAKTEGVLNNQYHLITSTEVFEHFSDPLKEIDKLVKLMKPGGILAIMTLFHELDGTTENEREWFSKWWYHRDPTHLSFYNTDTFRYIGEVFNLEILKTDNKRVITFRKKIL